MSRNFSKDEAERIFSLAAERQQARHREDANQLTLEDLEEAGAAAGIDPAFIRAAASDLLRLDRTTEERRFFGFPVELRESHVLPIPYTEDNWKKAVDLFSHVYNKPGYMREVGTTKRWSSEKTENQLPTHIIAEKDPDGTRFTIEQKTWPISLGFGIGASITLTMGILFLILWILNPTEGDLLIPTSILSGTGLLMGLIGAMTVKIMSKQEKQRFADVFQHLNNMADSDIADAEPDQVQKDPGAARSRKEGQIELEDRAEPEEIQPSPASRTRDSA